MVCVPTVSVTRADQGRIRHLCSWVEYEYSTDGRRFQHIDPGVFDGMISTGFLHKAGVVIPVRTVAYSHRSNSLDTSAPTIVPGSAVKAMICDSAELTRSAPGNNSFRAQASQHVVDDAAFGIAATEWQEIGTYFMVEIKHWRTIKDENCWNVYCYIYKGHRLFKELKYMKWKQHEIQNYFHRGITHHDSFFNNKGIVTTVHLGSDYQHPKYHYKYFDENDMPWVVLRDAIKLYNYLEAKCK